MALGAGWVGALAFSTPTRAVWVFEVRVFETVRGSVRDQTVLYSCSRSVSREQLNYASLVRGVVARGRKVRYDQKCPTQRQDKPHHR